MDSNNIDDFFKSKLHDRKLDFDASGWEEIEKSIGKKKTHWFLGRTFLSSFLLGVAVVGGILFYNEKSENVQTIVANVTSQEVTKDMQEASVSFSSQENESSQMVIENIKVEEIQNTTKATKHKNDQTQIASNNNISRLKDSSDPKFLGTGDISRNNSLRSKAAIPNDKGSGMQKVKREKVVDGEDQNHEATDDSDYIASADVEWNEDPKLMSLLVNSLEVNIPQAPLDYIPAIPAKQLNYLRKIELSTIVGGGIATGVRNPSDDTPVGGALSPVIGLRAGFPLHNQVSLNLNVLYLTRGGLSQEKLTTQPGFENKEVTVQSLRYLQFPLYIDYHYNRHSILVGMQYSYLAGMKSLVTNNMDNTSDINTKKVPYFTTDDLAGVVGYQISITEKLDFGARINYGLFDISDNDAGIYATNDKNIIFNAMLEYKLSKY